MITGHGGNVHALAKRNNCTIDDITDMSSNINPLGPPRGLEDFIAANVNLIRALPQPDAGDMVEAFSKFHGIDSARVLGGNGTTWFIYTFPIALKSKKVLIVGPTYSDYRDGCIMHKVPHGFYFSDKKDLFQPDMKKISTMASEFDTIIICNPNNPTGTLIPLDKIVSLLKKHPDTFFIVDESYLPFVDGAENITLVAETGFSNLIVLSSMSKIFRIPGLRTGYLCADPDIIEKFMAFYQPWSVNALAQAAIVHIFQNIDGIFPFLKETRDFLRKEKNLLYENFQAVPGIKLYPSETCFIIAELTGKSTSSEACMIAGDERILIRDCSNFHGLSEHYIRFSLRDHETNLKLTNILKKIK